MSPRPCGGLDSLTLYEYPSAFVVYLAADAPGAVELALTVLATMGEFWMIGYLLIKGVRSDIEPRIAMPEHVAV